MQNIQVVKLLLKLLLLPFDGLGKHIAQRKYKI